MIKTGIVINLQIEGIHRWSECNISEVRYLASDHRHIFHILAKKKVTDNDRQIEIICLKHQIYSYLQTKYGSVCNFGGMSCEMIAQEIFKKFGLYYCQVLEDNENGAEVWE